MLPPTRRRLRRFHDDEGGAVTAHRRLRSAGHGSECLSWWSTWGRWCRRAGRRSLRRTPPPWLRRSPASMGTRPEPRSQPSNLVWPTWRTSGTSLSGTTSTIIAQQGCGTSREYGYVTVKVATNQDLYFAPIFGIDTHGIAAEATAAWGMVVGPPVPVMASIGGPNAFSSCAISPTRLRVRLATSSWTTTTMEGASSRS